MTAQLLVAMATVAAAKAEVPALMTGIQENSSTHYNLHIFTATQMVL